MISRMKKLSKKDIKKLLKELLLFKPFNAVLQKEIHGILEGETSKMFISSKISKVTNFNPTLLSLIMAAQIFEAVDSTLWLEHKAVFENGIGMLLTMLLRSERQEDVY